MTAAARRVLITGAASGLGAALADRLVARGDRVLVTDLAASYDGPAGSTYWRLDITSDTDWTAARDWVTQAWGGLDVLVNNAGIATGGRIDVLTMADWQRALDVNLLGTVRGCATFTPMLKTQGAGHIVNVASIAGLVYPPGMSSYTAAKAGVVALSETLRYELDPWGIRVSVVCPSFVNTNLSASISGSDDVLNAIAARLIDRAELTADQIAVEIVKGMDAGRHVILTDASGRKAVAAKKFVRPLYDRQQLGFSARIRAAAARAGSGTGPSTSGTDLAQEVERQA